MSTLQLILVHPVLDNQSSQQECQKQMSPHFRPRLHKQMLKTRSWVYPVRKTFRTNRYYGALTKHHWKQKLGIIELAAKTMDTVAWIYSVQKNEVWHYCNVLCCKQQQVNQRLFPLFYALNARGQMLLSYTHTVQLTATKSPDCWTTFCTLISSLQEPM